MTDWKMNSRASDDECEHDHDSSLQMDIFLFSYVRRVFVGAFFWRFIS